MSEERGIKKRVTKALELREKITIFFQYPNAERIIRKSGNVIAVYDDSFDFDEIIDGESTYSYNYVVEIRGAK